MKTTKQWTVANSRGNLYAASNAITQSDAQESHYDDTENPVVSILPERGPLGKSVHHRPENRQSEAMTPDDPTPPKMRCTDLTGQRFGRWTVIERTVHPTRQGTFWRCVCDCGTTKEHINSAALQKGFSKSCGCMRLDLIRKPADEVHHQRNPLYSIWMSMRTRCCNPNHPSYKNYGARGIAIATEWLDNFDQFRRDMGPRPEGMTIGRIDNNGPYCKQNCRWVAQTSRTRKPNSAF